MLARSIVVVGGGLVGTPAARMADGLDADVTIFGRSISRLREPDQLYERLPTINCVE
ncbi:NAD-binding protein [Bradyrhizobium sp. USDA 4529]